MITAVPRLPEPSWDNPTPVDWSTGFRYVANVPPMAIGPQFMGLGQEREPFPTPLAIVTGLALGLGIGLFLGARLPRRR